MVNSLIINVYGLVQFNKEEGKDVHEAKLKVVYVPPPQPPSPITESNEEEGNSPKAAGTVDNGDRHHLLADPVFMHTWYFGFVVFFGKKNRIL